MYKTTIYNKTHRDNYKIPVINKNYIIVMLRAQKMNISFCSLVFSNSY